LDEEIMLTQEQRMQIAEEVLNSSDRSILLYKARQFKKIQDEMQDGIFCRYTIRNSIRDFLYLCRPFIKAYKQYASLYGDEDKDAVIDLLLVGFSQSIEKLYIEKFKNSLFKA
jgi:hypothetical protein